MQALHITDSTFDKEVLNSDKPGLVYFWATWCGPCRVVGPIIEEIAKEYDGKIVVAKVDTEESQNVAINYGIRSVPTLMIFKGGKVVEQMIGAVPKKRIVERLAAHIN
jgi:thioredoxin 1